MPSSYHKRFKSILNIHVQFVYWQILKIVRLESQTPVIWLLCGCDLIIVKYKECLRLFNNLVNNSLIYNWISISDAYLDLPGYQYIHKHIGMLGENGDHFTERISKLSFMIRFNESWSNFQLIVTNNMTTFVAMMAWHRAGAMPLSEPMMVS